MNDSVEFGKDLKLMSEVVVTSRKIGFTYKHWMELAQDENKMRQVLDVLLGRAEIKPIEHAVDFSADPFLPDGWSVEEHQKGKVAKLERKGDDLYLDGKKIEFWLSSRQKRGVITGNILRAKLKGKPVLNANLLDHLLKNPHLIPKTWKKDKNWNTRYIFFWGTVYRNADGRLYVRYLYWDGDRWHWNSYWLDNYWHSNGSAVALEN